jgi:hypothetical protein
MRAPRTLSTSRTVRTKRTSIGTSRATRFKNKHKRRQAKAYRGQGRPLG